jgi:hypothetical protein
VISYLDLVGHFCGGTRVERLFRYGSVNVNLIPPGSRDQFIPLNAANQCNGISFNLHSPPQHPHLIRNTNLFAMDNASIGDNTTVVGGPSSVANRADLKERNSPRFGNEEDYVKPFSADKKAKLPVNDFVRAADYMLDEREFFVSIGKDGLIAALQKLDKQLESVCIFLGGTYIY